MVNEGVIFLTSQLVNFSQLAAAACFSLSLSPFWGRLTTSCLLSLRFSASPSPSPNWPASQPGSLFGQVLAPARLGWLALAYYTAWPIRPQTSLKTALKQQGNRGREQQGNSTKTTRGHRGREQLAD